MEPLDYRPPMGDIVVLHQDDDLLVVDKPPGLLSVPGKAAEHADCLLTRLQQTDEQALLVHRLDMDTSGVMVFARNANAQRHLGLQFEKRGTKKTYEARVHGIVLDDDGEIDLPLIADWPNRPLQKVCYETGKPAQTKWTKRHIEAGCTRVSLEPKTGRSHQLRVHMKCIGHPICGDRFYGDTAERACSPRLMLHASVLSLRHPTGGAWHNFEAPVPF